MSISSTGLNFETGGHNWSVVNPLYKYFESLHLDPTYYGNYYIIPHDGLAPDLYQRLRQWNLPLLTFCKRADQVGVYVLPLLSMLHSGWDEEIRQLQAKDVDFAAKQRMVVWYGGLSGPLPIDQNVRCRAVTQLPAILDRLGLLYDIKFTHLFGRPHLSALPLGRYEPGWLGPEFQIDKQFLIALDGNTYPGNLHWSLAVNSLVFRNRSPWRCFLDEVVSPGTDFVDFSSDLSDFEERVRYVLNLGHEVEQIVAHSSQAIRSVTRTFVDNCSRTALKQCQDFLSNEAPSQLKAYHISSNARLEGEPEHIIFLLTPQHTGTHFARMLLESHSRVSYCVNESCRIDHECKPDYILTKNGVGPFGTPNERMLEECVVNHFQGTMTELDFINRLRYCKSLHSEMSGGRTVYEECGLASERQFALTGIAPREKHPCYQLFHGHCGSRYRGASFNKTRFKIVVTIRHPLLSVISAMRRTDDPTVAQELLTAYELVLAIPSAFILCVDLWQDQPHQFLEVLPFLGLNIEEATSEFVRLRPRVNETILKNEGPTSLQECEGNDVDDPNISRTPRGEANALGATASPPDFGILASKDQGAGVRRSCALFGYDL